MGLFLYWQHYLEKIHDNPESPFSFFTPPPLLKPSIWTRANGRIAVMVMIGFTNWAAFVSWFFWAQVRLFSDSSQVSIVLLKCLNVSSITRTTCTTLRCKVLFVSYLCPRRGLRAT